MALPVTDPVLIFALAMVIFVSAPLLFERFRVPGIVGLIVAGAIVGPHGLNLLARGATIELLGTVGLLFLMFLVGLELDLNQFNLYRNRSVVFGTLSFIVSQVIGTGLGIVLGYGMLSSLLLGAVFASHTVLAYPIASRLGIVKNVAVTTTLGGTILTETLALVMLAVVAGMVGRGIGPGFFLSLGLSLAVYMLAVLVGVPILTQWFLRRVRNEGTTEFVFMMAVLFTVSYLAHAAGLEPIIGALLTGLALNRLVPQQGPLINRINFVGDALFIPFFLLSVGMLVDVRALSTVQAWLVAGALTVGVVASKAIAAKATERVFRYTPEEGWVVFGLSVPHASGTLAIVLVGFELGLFDQSEVNGVVLVILTTSLVGPWVVEHFGRRVALQEEQKPYEPKTAPRRILIPVSNPDTEDALLDLAFLVRGSGATEPIYPLMVVRDNGRQTPASVAEAERMLSHAVVYAASAEVPVVPLTRVDQNIARGIARGIAETRTTTVIVGWDGGRSGSGIFGSVLDQLLDSTDRTVVVAKVGHPLSTTNRIVLVLPPLIHRHPGFYDAARTVKVVAAQLGATMLALVVGRGEQRYDELLRPIRPSVNTTIASVDGWSPLLAKLRDEVVPGDLVVLISAERGTLPWHPQLERLPAQLAGLIPESFLVIYPGEADSSAAEQLAVADLPRGLHASRIVLDMPPVPYREALRRLLETEFHADRRRLSAILDSLLAEEHAFTTELRPGVVVPHARVIGLEEPILFLGTSHEGIEFPMFAEPAKSVFLLLSPADRPQEHLRSLAEIARLVSHEEQMEELLRMTRLARHAEPSEAR